MNSLSRFLLGAAMTMAAAAPAFAADTFVGDRNDFRDETIYFAMTTRFYDGDPSNNTYCWDGVKNVNDPEWRGDFKGLIAKLDYIKALGFTTVWITPVVENASGLDYHGYHAFNFQKVDPRYESDDCKFQDLITAAHDKGMKIVLDIVLNHTGNFGEEKLCPMFVKDYSKNLSNILTSMKRHPNSVLPAGYDLQDQQAHYYRISAMKNEDGVNHDNHNHYHHVATAWNWDEWSRWYAQIAGDCVDLNTENPAVSEYLVDCYGKFIKMGVDGFRIDTSGHISRLTFNKAFIPQFTKIAEESREARKGGPFFMFGEVCARERNVVYRGHANLSPYFYTWKEEKDYAWDYSKTSWDNVVVLDKGHGDHTNIKSQDQHGADYFSSSYAPNSTNAFLQGNKYHTPDYSKYSGFSVIDFPMHWNFGSTGEAWGIRSGDKLYNDASYNVVYVDSHDYAPDGAPESQRFSKGQDVWASNLDLMFTFRGIPCIYYGSEIEFKKGCIIDKGADLALKDSGRAYFGGYIEGSVTVKDFAQYSDAKGNMAATLSHPLALHVQRLNLLRAAIPALRKGQYSTDGCSGGTAAFKRRYTDSKTDSYVLVVIGGTGKFTGVENGTYVDAITGDTKTVSNGTLETKACSGSGNMRVYVLNTALTKAPGKVGVDGKYLYDTTPAKDTQTGYDGNEEPLDTKTKRDNGEPEPIEPGEIIEPTMSKGEQAVFFDNSNTKWSSVKVYVWKGGTEYTGAWSGKAMTNLGNGIWKWTYTGDKVIPEGAGVVFNGGGSQTKNLEWTNGGVYTFDGYQRTIEGAGVIEPKPEEPVEPVVGDIKVYFDNSASNWGSVYAYCWDDNHMDSNAFSGAWPGKQLTVKETLGGKELYVFSFSTTQALSNAKVIFNIGSNSAQTGDFDLVNGGIYTNAGLQQSSGLVGVAANANIDVRVADGKLYIFADREGYITVARADGTVRSIRVVPGNSTVDLPAGFYIVNGKKVIL